MPGSLAERATKLLLVVSTAAAIALHLFVDPAAGPLLQALTATSFVAAFACARVWRARAIGVVAALAPVAPVILAAIVRVDALNLFSTVSLAALFGAMLPNLALDRWTLPRSWRAPLAIWGLTLALAWPVMIVREAGLRLGALRDTGALDSWALLSTPQVESCILYSAITQLVALLWLDVMCAEGQNADARLHPGVHGLWIGATAASVVAVYQGLVDISFLSGGPWPGLQRAAGTLLDANAYGAIAALAGPVAFVSIPHLRIRHTRITQGAVLAINWAGAWMSGSRTGLLCGAFGTVALVYQLARANRGNSTAGRESTSLLAGVVAIVLVLIMNLLRSRTGRAWRALRGHEVVAEALGIDVARYKLLAFVISSMITALAGALFAYFRHFVSIDAFSLYLTIQYVAMTIVGGMGSLLGALLGAAFVVLLPYVIETAASVLPSRIGDLVFALNYAAFGVVMILFLLFEPEGLIGIWRRIVSYIRLWPFKQTLRGGGS